jgi:hypothetical protein
LKQGETINAIGPHSGLRWLQSELLKDLVPVLIRKHACLFRAQFAHVTMRDVQDSTAKYPLAWQQVSDMHNECVDLRQIAGCADLVSYVSQWQTQIAPVASDRPGKLLIGD